MGSSCKLRRIEIVSKHDEYTTLLFLEHISETHLWLLLLLRKRR